MENETTLKQKKIELANSEYAPVIIELIKDLIERSPLIGDTEYATIVNAVKFDTQSSILAGMVDHLENIRKGSLLEIQH